MKTSLQRIRREKLNYIRIFKKESDFCDTCTEFNNLLETFDNEEMITCIQTARNIHREIAKIEFKRYQDILQEASSGNSISYVHFVFDFAEKVLLPYLIQQPGLLHFITGLKVDLFGIHFCNLKKTFVFCLPEGH